MGRLSGRPFSKAETMKTVYDVKTGEPRRLHNIDIREQLAAGLIRLEAKVPVAAAIAPVKVKPIIKPVRKSRPKKAKE